MLHVYVITEWSEGELSTLVTISRELSVGTPPRNDNVRPEMANRLRFLIRGPETGNLPYDDLVFEGIG